MVATMPSISIEYVRVPVTASVVLDTQVVEMALTASTSAGQAPAVPTTWQAATWVGTAGTTRSARLLIGPLAAGTYDVWIKFTDSPEAPARVAGKVTVT